MAFLKLHGNRKKQFLSHMGDEEKEAFLKPLWHCTQIFRRLTKAICSFKPFVAFMRLLSSF
jgi:hypothetical protein